MTPHGSAYEVAVEFIRLADIQRMRELVGLPYSVPLHEEMSECRYQLDVLLGHNARAWTTPQWNALVRSRLVAMPVYAEETG